MAELKDFYTEGEEVLADVEYESSMIYDSAKVTIPLSVPAEDVTVNVTQEQGTHADYDSTSGSRLKFDVTTDATYRLAERARIAGQALNVKLVRNPADTDTNLPNTKWQPEVRVSSGTWPIAIGWNECLRMDDNSMSVELSNTGTVDIAPSDTNWVKCNGTLGNYGWSDGRFCSHALKKANNNYKQNSNYPQKWLGYHHSPAFLSTISSGDVVFHFGFSVADDTYGISLHGQCIGEVDVVNGRMRGIEITDGTTTNSHQQPYDLNTNFTHGHMFYQKGYKVTQVEQTVTLTTAATILDWTSTPAYTDDFNHYVGAVVKFWDGADPTKYRLVTISQAAGTLQCTMQHPYDVNGYVFSDGVQANYEMWLPYDLVGGDTAYDDIILPDMPADSWSIGNVMIFPGNEEGGGTTNSFDASHYQYRANDWYWNNSGVEFWLLNSNFTTALNASPAPDNRYGDCIGVDYSTLQTRFGDTPTGAGIDMKSGEIHKTNWYNMMVSADGLIWQMFFKDPSVATTAIGGLNPTHDLATNPLFKARNCVKFEGGQWYANDYGNDPTALEEYEDRFTDPTAFFVWWQTENWVAMTGLTDVSQSVEAVCYHHHLEQVIWTDMPWSWNNTHNINNTATDQNMQVITYDYGISDVGREAYADGLPIWSMVGDATIKSIGNQHVLSADGTSVDVIIGETTDGYDSRTHGKTRVVIKGKRL